MAEGDWFKAAAILGPLAVEIFKQAYGDSFTAFAIRERTHHLQAPSDFSKTAFDNIGGSNNLMD